MTDGTHGSGPGESDPSGRSDPDHPGSGERRDEALRSDWTRRAEQARRDGSWYSDREPTPMPSRWRARRFLLTVLATLAASVVAQSVLALAKGRAVGISTVEGALLHSALLALLLGFGVAFPSRGRRPD